MHKIIYEANPQHEDVQILGDGIMEYAKQKKDHASMDFFAFFIRDENNHIQGGCNGNSLYGCLYIDQLWVIEALRNKGYGTQLLQMAEEQGRKLQCTFAAVNTMDWEALGFYQKMGYCVEFERHGFSKNSVFYFLRKELTMQFPKIQGLSHITLICKDLEKTAHMLKEVFGAKEIYSSDKKNFSLSKEKFFSVAGMWVAIMLGESVAKTYNHIAFKVDENNIDYFSDKIQSLGLEILPGRSRNKTEEGSSLYFYDYDNHLFELHTGKLDKRLDYYAASV